MALNFKRSHAAAPHFATFAQSAGAATITFSTVCQAHSVGDTRPSGLWRVGKNVGRLRCRERRVCFRRGRVRHRQRPELCQRPGVCLARQGRHPIVLQNSDNDGDPITAVNAATAAALIAAALNTDGGGFFAHINSWLNVNRLVCSSNLSDGSADLSIAARISNPRGAEAIGALPTVREENSAAVPEPSTHALALVAPRVMVTVPRRPRQITAGVLRRVGRAAVRKGRLSSRHPGTGHSLDTTIQADTAPPCRAARVLAGPDLVARRACLRSAVPGDVCSPAWRGDAGDEAA